MSVSYFYCFSYHHQKPQTCNLLKYLYYIVLFKIKRYLSLNMSLLK